MEYDSICSFWQPNGLKLRKCAVCSQSNRIKQTPQTAVYGGVSNETDGMCGLWQRNRIKQTQIAASLGQAVD